MNNTTDDNRMKYQLPPTDRAAINRANSQHSTGPRTEAGKQRSSLNATRHALTGQTIVLPSDDLEVYQKRAQEFLNEYQPKGPTENQLVQTLSDAAWRLNRIAAIENNLHSLGIAEQEDSFDTEHPQARTALALAKAFRDQDRVIANLGMHQQRLARLFEKALKQIREIQAQRRNIEKEQLKNAASIAEVHDEKGKTNGPAGNGFVFSPPKSMPVPTEPNGSHQHASLIVNAPDPGKALTAGILLR